MWKVKQTEQAGGREEEEQQHCGGDRAGKLSGVHLLLHSKSDNSLFDWLYEAQDVG